MSEGIPRMARIVAVANAFDIMTAALPYRAGMPAEVAFAEIEKLRGFQFDPEIATAFLAIRQKLSKDAPVKQSRMSLRRETMRGIFRASFLHLRNFLGFSQIWESVRNSCKWGDNV